MRQLAGPRKQTKKEQREGKPLDFSVTPEELRLLVEHNARSKPWRSEKRPRSSLATPLTCAPIIMPGARGVRGAKPPSSKPQVRAIA